MASDFTGDYEFMDQSIKPISSARAERARANSVKTSNRQSIPVSKTNPRKRKVKGARLRSSIAAVIMVATFALGTTIGWTGNEINHFLKADQAIMMELKEEVGNSVLPEEKEKRQEIYESMIESYNLDINKNEDKAFLMWLVSYGSSKENRDANFKQALNDFGFFDTYNNGVKNKDASYYMCAQLGYYAQYSDGSKYPDVAYYNKVQLNRYDELVNARKDGQKGVNTNGI